MTDRAARAHDIVLFGATGFTGRLVADYLVAHGPDDLKLALAGRNRQKLEQVRAELARDRPRATELPILVADAHDAGAIDEVVRDARVVCTTVGPYAKYGRTLVAACAKLGTDYCDLAGEVAFMRETIDRHQPTAEATGARIVHACGFDSIPSDLGVFVLADWMKREHGLGLASDHAYFGETKGGFSGGTVESMKGFLDGAKEDREVLRLAGDPYALVPDRKRDRGPDAPDQRGPAWSEDLRTWTAPFVMAAVNTRVVRRSNVLLGGYGAGFRYEESMSLPKGPKGFAAAVGVTGAMVGFFAALSFPPTRRLLDRRLPQPGEGPSKAERDAGYFVTRHVATSEPGTDGRSIRAMLTIRGHADPGYGETAKMLGEAALCLAKDELPAKGGVTTPAAAMGMKLVDRLKKAGESWDVTAL